MLPGSFLYEKEPGYEARKVVGALLNGITSLNGLHKSIKATIKVKLDQHESG